MKARESIVGGNLCTVCLYNIPRAVVMITVPGIIILVSGAAMTAFNDGDWSWNDGLSMLALVFLVLGGVWTLGGLIYWFIAWCRLKPKRLLRHRTRSNVVSATYDNRAVQLDNVISHSCDTSSVKAIPSSAISGDTHEIKTISEQNDTCSSVPDDVIYTVP